MIMDYSRNRTLLLRLLQAQTAEELERVVEEENLGQQEWRPYGGRANNVATAEGQALRADNSLMEKITNSIDAILMRRCYEEGVDPRDKTKAPETMEKAVDRFFGGKESLRKERSKFAKEWLRVTAEGHKSRPTMTIIDRGEGQQPSDIEKTILSLNKDIKAKIYFVYGRYNQGGSSPLGFAGRENSYDLNYLQLILCRRAPMITENVEMADDYDHFGFTIVRRRFDQDSERFTYEYVVDRVTGKVFSFPEENKPIEIDDYEFREGCVIKLYDYQLPQRGNIVFRGLNEFIEKKLPNAPIPIFLKELRDGYSGGKEYTIFGLREKMLRKKEDIQEPYPKIDPVDLGDIGKKEVELFIFKHKATTKGNQDDVLAGVFFIKDGLVLHYESSSWLKNDCGLVDLAPYISAFIDISTISPPIAQMLHSGREQFKKNITTQRALAGLKKYFANDTLKKLDKEYGDFNFSSSDENLVDDVFMKELEKDVKNQPESRDYFELGEDIPVEEGDNGEELLESEYEGTYLPEKFELVGDNPRAIVEGSFGKVSFDTGADVNLFERRKDRGEYDWEKSDHFQIVFESFRNGRLTFRIDPNPDTKPLLETKLLFYLRVPSEGIEMETTVNVSFEGKIPYEGKEYPTFFNTPPQIEIPAGGV